MSSLPVRTHSQYLQEATGSSDEEDLRHNTAARTPQTKYIHKAMKNNSRSTSPSSSSSSSSPATSPQIITVQPGGREISIDEKTSPTSPLPLSSASPPTSITSPADIVRQHPDMYYKSSKAFSSWHKCVVSVRKDGVLFVLKLIRSKPTISVYLTEVVFQNVKTTDKKNSIRCYSKRYSPFYLSCDKAADMEDFTAFLKKMGAVDKDKSSVTTSKIRKAFAGVNLLTNTHSGLSDDSPAGTTKQTDSPKKQLSKIEQTDVGKWNVKDVNDWLHQIRDIDGETMGSKFSRHFSDNDIDGEVLLLMNEDSLNSIEIFREATQVRILQEIEKLRKHRVFVLTPTLKFQAWYTHGSNQAAVLPKFPKEKQIPLSHFAGFEEELCMLCDAKLIRQTYLSVEPLPNKLVQKFAEEENSSEKGNIKEIYDFADNQEYYTNKKVIVRLIITEISHSDSSRTAKKIISPITSAIPLFPSEIQPLRATLLVGPFYLEWQNSSLCVPKRICGSMRTFVRHCDIPLATLDKSLSEVADELSAVISRWNLCYSYKKTVNSDELNAANSQHFVDAILQLLGVKMDQQTVISSFLSDIRTKGEANMIFRPPYAFIKRFGLDESKQLSGYSFNTHKELDEMVIGLSKQLPTIERQFVSEYQLLQSFDRCFWIRHMMDKEEERFRPLGYTAGSNYHKCPITDDFLEDKYVVGEL